MSFFASCSDQSTLLLRRAKSLGVITNMRLQKIEIFQKENQKVDASVIRVLRTVIRLAIYRASSYAIGSACVGSACSRGAGGYL